MHLSNAMIMSFDFVRLGRARNCPNLETVHTEIISIKTRKRKGRIIALDGIRW